MQLIVTASDFVAAPYGPQHLPVLVLLPGEWGRILISVELWGFLLPRRSLSLNASKMRKNLAHQACIVVPGLCKQVSMLKLLSVFDLLSLLHTLLDSDNCTQGVPVPWYGWKVCD